MSDEKNFHKRGFTLIELIVVISVLAILSVVGIAAYVSYSRAQTLNAAAGDLAVMLNLAKSRAYSQVKPYEAASSCVGAPLDGYQVKICSSSCGTVDYELDVKCGPVPFPIKTVKLPTNLSFGNSATYFFPVLKGGVVITPTIANIITITGYTTLKKFVTIDSSGNIRVN